MNKKKELFRVIKFALFSASAGIVEALATGFFQAVIHWDYWIAYTIGLTLSVLWNFTVNRKFTFHSAANVPIAMLKVAAFYAVFAPVSIILGDLAAGENDENSLIVFIVTLLCNVVLEYFYCTFVVYRNSIDTAKNQKK